MSRQTSTLIHYGADNKFQWDSNVNLIYSQYLDIKNFLLKLIIILGNCTIDFYLFN